MYSKQFWDKIYSHNPSKLPWIASPGPDNLLDLFSSLIINSKLALDFGCGNGRHALYLCKKGLVVEGVDISDKAIEICNSLNTLKFKNLYYQIDSIGEIKNSYDGILCWGVMHHINPKFRKHIYSRMFNILKRNGVILLGGFSSQDCEFQGKKRISLFTGMETWPIDCDIREQLNGYKLTITESSVYQYIEQPTEKLRTFNYYFLKKE